MSVTCSDVWLDEYGPEQTENAQYILDYLLAHGWTKNAICGMLGNMKSESSINPGKWQFGYTPFDPDAGFGLVQWTPYTNYYDWAGPSWYSMDRELERILYELDNGIQFYSTSSYPMTFSEFVVSVDTPEYLAYVFLHNYERPASMDQPWRQTAARYWYDNLTGGPTPEPPGGLLRHVTGLHSTGLRKIGLRGVTI